MLGQPDVIKQYVRGAAPELYLELCRHKESRVQRELQSIERWLVRHRPEMRPLREALGRLITAAVSRPQILHSDALDSWIDSFVYAATTLSDLTRINARLSRITVPAQAPDFELRKVGLAQVRTEAQHRFQLLAASDVLLLGRDRRVYYCPWELRPVMLHDVLARAFETCVVLNVAQSRLPRREFAASAGHLTDAMFTLRDYASPTFVGERLLDAIASTIPALRSSRVLLPGREPRNDHFARWLRSRYSTTDTTDLGLLLHRAVNDKTLVERWRVLECILAADIDRQMRRDALLRSVKDVDRSVRWRAIEGLRATGELAAARAIRDAMADDDDWVRWHARRALVTWPGAPVVIRSLLKDVRNPRVQAALLDCLARVSERNDDIEIFLRAAQHSHKAVRAAAVSYLAQRETLGCARDEVFTCLRDEARDVRLTALKHMLRIRNVENLPTGPLWTALSDSDPRIRSAAALLLSRIGVQSSEIAAELVRSLSSGEFACDAFERLAFSLPKHLERCDPNVLASLVAESVARGVMPTIGAKLWKRDAILEFPSRTYPWLDQGVRYSWQSHTRIAEHTGVTQLCIHADWFANVHWVALADIVIAGGCGVPNGEAPASIEGYDVGLVIESGGHTVAIPGMRAWPNLRLTDRIDFLYANSPKVIQTLMYMALAARTSNASGIDRFARQAAQRFEARFGADISAAGFNRLLATPWYTRRGWKSSRYGIRHEKPYGVQRGELTRFRDFLRSRHGVRVGAKVARAIMAEIDAVTDMLWHERLRRYPRAALQRLASGDMPQSLSRHVHLASRRLA